MSGEQIPDTATVMATYATAATYRQSPNPARQVTFKAWLAATVRAAKAEAWAEGRTKGILDTANLGKWNDDGHLVVPPTPNPYESEEDSHVDQ